MKRSTLVAGALLAALSGYIYLYEREPGAGGVVEEGELVFEAEREAVVHIEVEARAREPAVLEKRDEGWRLVAPLETEADEEEVGLLLDNLETMRFERVVARAADVELADFGLEAPVASATFRTESGEVFGIRFGKDTPTSGNRYAIRSGDDGILVLASYLSLNFEKTAWDLRDKRIFGALAEDDQVERLTIARGSDELVLVPDPVNGGYRLESPFLARGDRFEPGALVREIREAEMQELVSEEEEGAATAFDTPTATARLSLSSGETLVLEVGAKKDFDYYGRSPARDERFLVEGGLVDDLVAPATAYVAKELFSMRADDVAGVRLQDRIYEKSEAGDDPGESPMWHQAEAEPEPGDGDVDVDVDGDGDVDPGAVQSLVAQLTAAAAESIVVLSGDEAPAELTRITLVTREPAREETVVIGTRDGTALARRDGEGVLLELSEASWEGIRERLSLAPASRRDP